MNNLLVTKLLSELEVEILRAEDRREEVRNLPNGRFGVAMINLKIENAKEARRSRDEVLLENTIRDLKKIGTPRPEFGEV